MLNGIMQMFIINLERIDYVANKDVNTGEGRANAIASDLESLGLGNEHLREYFSSGCYDGQYILSSIQDLLTKRLGMPGDFSCHWDADHYFEIIHKNVISERESVKKALDLTNSIKSAFARSGKRLQLMLEQNLTNNEENVKNKTLKSHSKVCLFVCVWFCHILYLRSNQTKHSLFCVLSFCSD